MIPCGYPSWLGFFCLVSVNLDDYLLLAAPLFVLPCINGLLFASSASRCHPCQVLLLCHFSFCILVVRCLSLWCWLVLDLGGCCGLLSSSHLVLVSCVAVCFWGYSYRIVLFELWMSQPSYYSSLVVESIPWMDLWRTGILLCWLMLPCYISLAYWQELWDFYQKLWWNNNMATGGDRCHWWQDTKTPCYGQSIPLEA